MLAGMVAATSAFAEHFEGRKELLMIQQHPATTPQATVAAILERRRKPQVFFAEWNNAKTKTRDPNKNRMQEAWGTCYPNGLVTLDNGQRFESLSEMHHTMDLHGTYEIHWLDDERIETARRGQEAKQ